MQRNLEHCLEKKIFKFKGYKFFKQKLISRPSAAFLACEFLSRVAIILVQLLQIYICILYVTFRLLLFISLG